ncbi:CoA-transferase family III domain-containing protein [Sporodiniella umbellata]|nr:CoA-transferase family III domain-containing protein [Sporodiniella umbellata]
MQPLRDIVVLEMAGLAPAPFAGMVLADFGAKVIRVDKTVSFNSDILTRHKQSVALNLKDPKAVQILLKMCEKADVLLDPFRPGVMEALGLGPKAVFKVNPRLVYARLSGYGQTGSTSAGHDINYLAGSGVLDMLRKPGEAPVFPMNLLADFGGGALVCVVGILVALLERVHSQKGQVVDGNLTLGTAYMASFPFLMRKYGILWDGESGTNTLDGGAHFYNTYQTKDNLFMAVGAIETQFYACLLEKLGLDKEEYLPRQHNKEEWLPMKQKFQEIFSKRTQEEWSAIFAGSDACVTPVLPPPENIPQPFPILSRTPALPAMDSDEPTFLEPGEHTAKILKEFGIPSNEIQQLLVKKDSRL